MPCSCSRNCWMNLKPYNFRKAKESFSALFFIPHKKKKPWKIKISAMRITGLEPARVASLEPKSSASANFAISANKKSLWFLLGEGTRGGAITAFFHTSLFYALSGEKSTVKTHLCKEKKPIPPIIGWNGFFMNQEGFEPPTHGLEGRCSIQLSYWSTLLAQEILCHKTSCLSTVFSNFSYFFKKADEISCVVSSAPSFNWCVWNAPYSNIP